MITALNPILFRGRIITEKQRLHFWERVDRRGSDECWPYKAKKDKQGYGALQLYGMTTGAHHIAFLLATEQLIDGWWICHHCDNPPCCNPNHLFRGTPADNAHDRQAKGRSNNAVGERAGLAKLTADKVREIRGKYVFGVYGPRRLSKEYGVCTRVVYRIIKRLTWKHVTDKVDAQLIDSLSRDKAGVKGQEQEAGGCAESMRAASPLYE